MRMRLITGGVRSGKSDYAQQLALEMGGDDVTFIATAEPGDAEMADRIARHRAGRPPAWSTIETATAAGTALRAAASQVVLLDCITLLASNAMLRAEPAGKDPTSAVNAEVAGILDAAAARTGELILVTNEVGLGVVPATPLGRLYRDLLGEANRRLAERAESVVMMVSGIPLVVR
jgi:adenosyl cobinamide kinase/adenosyl cobinamide phosphate guanylyltransferase